MLETIVAFAVSGATVAILALPLLWLMRRENAGLAQPEPDDERAPFCDRCGHPE